MVRADLTQRAPHALAALTAEYGLTFTRRAQPGGRSWDDAYVASDDRVRLWLDGHLLIDEWYEHREQASSALITLTKGQRYALRLDYFQERARAAAKLLWSNPSTPRQVIPQSQLYSDTPGAGLAGPGEDGAPSGVSLLPNPWQDQDVGLVGQAGIIQPVKRSVDRSGGGRETCRRTSTACTSFTRIGAGIFTLSPGCSPSRTRNLGPERA